MSRISRLNFWDRPREKDFASLCFYLLLFAIPFGVRKLLFQFTFGFDEYEAVWLYGSDFVILLFLGAAWWQGMRLREDLGLPRRVRVALAVMLACAGVSIVFAPLKVLAFVQMLRLCILVAFSFAVAALVRKEIISRKTIFASLGFLATIESLIALFQFARQQSLGLWFLGESVLGQQKIGTAKIVVEGAQLVRGYGTFPHPNVLGAFLVLGLVSLSYLFLLNMNRTKGKQLFGWLLKLPRLNLESVLILLGINMVLMGLVLTFSRTAWAVAFGALALLFAGMWMRRKEYGISKSSLAALAIALSIFSGTIAAKMSWAIFPRAYLSASEPAVAYRLSYTELGFALAKSNPLGVGIGNSVFFAVKNHIYQAFGMPETWQWQPVHNIYLLIAAEIGVVGLIAFLAAVFFLFWPETKKFTRGDSEFFIASVMLAALLLFGFFDHFLWTLQPGKLMLWLTIGLAVRLNKASELRL